MAKTYLNNICSLIPAAGLGTRSGLSYPKTLYKVNNNSILINILNLTSKHVSKNVVVINPKFEKLFKDELINKNFNINFSKQKNAKGMGDAILCAENNLNNFDDILLIWGDIPYLRLSTIDKLITNHFKSRNDFTFVTRKVENPYTYVLRDKNDKIISLKEASEEKNDIDFAERDIGVFLFKRDIVLNLLKKDLLSKYGKSTGEHGFLYIVEHLVKANYKVEALQIASINETKSLNSLKDLI